jgi:hypothetical protein
MGLLHITIILALSSFSIFFKLEEGVKKEVCSTLQPIELIFSNLPFSSESQIVLIFSNPPFRRFMLKLPYRGMVE